MTAPLLSVLFLATVWIIYSVLPPCLPSETMQKKPYSNMGVQGAQGYSAEWTKPRVPPMRVFVWPSKPGQTNVWVGDSSLAACQMWVMVLWVKLLSQQTSPAILLLKQLEQGLNRPSSFHQKEVGLFLGRWSLWFILLIISFHLNKITRMPKSNYCALFRQGVRAFAQASLSINQYKMVLGVEFEGPT